MTSLQIINKIIEIAIYIQAGAALVFCVRYQMRSRGAWRHTIMGWHVMALTFVDFLFSGELTIAHLWPHVVPIYAFRWSIAIVFFIGALITFWRLLILEFIQPRKERSDEVDKRSS